MDHSIFDGGGKGGGVPQAITKQKSSKVVKSKKWSTTELHNPLLKYLTVYLKIQVSKA